MNLDVWSGSFLETNHLSSMLIQRSSDAIFGFDPDFRYRLWNPTMERVTRLAAQHVIGQPAFELFPYLKETGQDRLFHDALAGNEVPIQRQPYRIPQNGKHGFFDGHFVPLRDERDEVIGALAILRDVTGSPTFEIESQRLLSQMKQEHERAHRLVESARKTVQQTQMLASRTSKSVTNLRTFKEEEKARREAERANEVTRQFLALVSHELRTPLTSIKGFITTLLAKDIEWDAERSREFLEIVDAETDKLVDLVEQMLDISQFNLGQTHVEKSSQPLSDILDSARARLQSLTRRHEFVVDVPDDLPPVTADARRIAEVIVNLVDNAVKFSPSGTRIVLSASLVGDAVQVDIADEGAGIPPEDRPYVFNAFRQVKNRFVKRGAGLGLAICRSVIEAHRGKIWIQDREPPGATVSFTLPVESASTKS
jgi:PAS domain S-box-containing protein